ncbi:MAG: GyrI-like domain-containing protein [Bacteroidota bacterium]
MKIFKRILLTLGALVALLLIIGFLLPREVSVSRSSVIAAPQWQVFTPVADLTQWNQWAKWNMLDPEMQIKWGQVKMGEGASYSWTSEHPNVGNGAMRISEVKGMDKLLMDMDFDGQGGATSSFVLTQVPEGTGVTWTIDMDMGPGPIGRWMGLLMDQWVGADFEEGLANLGSYVASAPAPMEVRKVQVPAKHVLVVSAKADPDNLSAMLGECYGKIMYHLQAQGVEANGAPFAKYDFAEDGTVDITAGIPISEAMEGAGEVQYVELAACEALKANYFGAYGGVNQAYDYLSGEIEKMGVEYINTSGALGWEEYITDPVLETDTAKWLTEVYIPIRVRANAELEEVAD